MSKRTWYIVRHGETVWNREGRKQGQSDSPLTNLGIVQAQRIGDWLRFADLSKFKIISSPLGRAMATAQILEKQLDIPFGVNSLLSEHSFGEWEGMTEEEIRTAYPGQLEMRYANNITRWYFQIPGGESYDLLRNRVRDFCRLHADTERLIVVTHEMISKVMRGYLGNLPREAILELDHPQDTLYVINEDGIEEVEV